MANTMTVNGIEIPLEFSYTWEDDFSMWRREVWFDTGYDCWMERESHCGYEEGDFWTENDYPINGDEVEAYWKEYCEES